MVLVLVAVLGGMVALSVGRLQAAPGLDRRAATLAARLTIAAQTAVMTGQDAAFAWAPDGYRFLSLRGGTWVPHGIPELGLVEVLGSGLDLSVGGAGDGGLLIRADLTPADAAPFRLALRDGTARVDVVFDGLTGRVLAAEGLR